MTHEDVKDYVRHVTKDEDNEGNEDSEMPEFLEKVTSIAPMTRSRIKQALEKDGEVIMGICSETNVYVYQRTHYLQQLTLG